MRQVSEVHPEDSVEDLPTREDIEEADCSGEESKDPAPATMVTENDALRGAFVFAEATITGPSTLTTCVRDANTVTLEVRETE